MMMKSKRRLTHTICNTVQSSIKIYVSAKETDPWPTVCQDSGEESIRGLLVDASQIGIMFDCDGTLIDSMPMWREVEEKLGRRAGVVLSQTDTDLLTILTIPEVGAFFYERYGLGSSPHQVVDMIDELVLEYYQTCASERSGALEFVKQLAAAGVHMSVVSSSPQPYLQAGLTRCGFAPYLDAIVSVDDVGRSKRESTVWDRACDLMGTQKENTWGMEDAAYAVQTLNSAGYRTLAIYDCDLSGTQEELKKLAHHMVMSFEELSAQTLINWTK